MKPIVIIVISIVVLFGLLLVINRNNNENFKSSINDEIVPKDLSWDPHKDTKTFFISGNTLMINIPQFINDLVNDKYWIVKPLGDKQFDITIYDSINLDEIINTVATEVNVVENRILVFSLPNINNFELTGAFFYKEGVARSIEFNALSLDGDLPLQRAYGYLIPKMVKQMNISKLTTIGTNITLYGFSNTQKIILTCIGNDESYIYYDSQLYDNNVLVKSNKETLSLQGSGSTATFSLNIINHFGRLVLSTNESYAQDKSIGILINPYLTLNTDAMILCFNN